MVERTRDAVSEARELSLKHRKRIADASGNERDKILFDCKKELKDLVARWHNKGETHSLDVLKAYDMASWGARRVLYEKLGEIVSEGYQHREVLIRLKNKPDFHIG